METTENSGTPLLQRLRETLAEKPPFCNGTLELPADRFSLYYGKGRDARQVNLSDASERDLDELEQACEAATFGRNHENVLDETYRKAGKMDSENFMPALDVERSTLVNVVRTGLLTGRYENKAVRAELYKLNVYGKSSFFKPHKDTPRGTDMFGSLVIVFPTPHEGGALVLRHQGREWTFDAAQTLSVIPAASSSAASESEPKSHIAYVAFFSDVEHEVTPVVRGHRVTITYNLYWADAGPAPLPAGLTMLHPLHANEPEVERALAALLDDPNILPEGGTLGFGLRHAYPFPEPWEYTMANPLESLQGWLKGGDAVLFRTCTALGLRPLLRLVFDSDSYDDLQIMMDRMVELRYSDTSEEHLLLNEHNGILLFSKHFPGEEPENASRWNSYYRGTRYEVRDTDKSVDVHWVTEPETWNWVRSDYITYGNEPSAAYIYLVPSMMVDIGPLAHRQDISAVSGVHTPATGKDRKITEPEQAKDEED